MDEILEELTAEFDKKARELEQPNHWINSHVSKGPIVVTWPRGKYSAGEELWVISDRKTPGYPSVNFVGLNVLTGGNLREFAGEIPSTPLELYQKQMEEELGSRWKLGSSLGPVITAYADYLEFYSVNDHGNENMRRVSPVTNGDVYAIVSLFGLTIIGEKLQGELGVPSKDLSVASVRREILKRMGSTETGLSIYTVKDLELGALDNFVTGDDRRLQNYLDTMYGIRFAVNTSRGKSTRLHQTTPLTPYSQRETMQYSRVNPFRSKTDAASPFKKV